MEIYNLNKKIVFGINMSQLALLEIRTSDNKNFNFSNMLIKQNYIAYLIDAFKLNLSFANCENKYYKIVERHLNELDILVFDWKIDLNDYDSIFNILSPLFEFIDCFIKSGIPSENIKLFISEDYAQDIDDYIIIKLDSDHIKELFIDYISKNLIININCFPSILFVF